MAYTTPLSLLYDQSTNSIVVPDGTTPAGTSGVMMSAYDGTNSRRIVADTTGRQIMVGAGIAGTPAGGIVSIQGVASGTVIPTAFSDISPATQTVTTLDLTTSTVTGANGQILYIGTPTAGSTATFTLPSSGSVTVQSSSLGTGTLAVEVSMDGGAGWVRPNVYQVSTANYTNGFTASFVATLSVAGFTHVRVRTITSWSGNATITVRETQNQGVVTIGSMLPSGTNTIGNINLSESLVDNAAFTDGTSKVVPSGYIFDEVAGTTLSENDVGAARVDLKRAQVFVLEDATTRGVRQTVKAASTAAVAADIAAVVSLSPNSPITIIDTVNSGVLGALNANVSVSTAGQGTVGIQLAAGTLIGTIVPEISVDSGTTWNLTYFSDPATGSLSSSLVFASANTASNKVILIPGGSGLVRVRISAFTSGTANLTIRASNIQDEIRLYEGAAGNPVPPTTIQVGGTDGTNLRALVTDTSGRVVMVGAAADGAAVAGNPVLVAGYDGTNARRLVQRTGDFALEVYNPDYEFSEDKRLRVSQDTVAFFDSIDGSALNTSLWSSSTTTMTITQAAGALTLNAGSSLASGAFAILTSNKQFLLLTEYAALFQGRIRVVPQTNAVIEFGPGAVSGTAAPTNGAFFRWSGTATLTAVLNFGGTETTAALSAVGLSSSNYYIYEITLFENSVSYEITDTSGTVVTSTEIAMPATQSSLFTLSHISHVARVYNSAATSAAAQLFIGSVNVQYQDLVQSKSWAEQLVGIGRHASVDPAVFTQTAQYANSADPAAATLSNTAAGYATLGGKFLFTIPAGSTTDYALFAYQIPAGYQLYITNMAVHATVTGAGIALGTACVLEWGMAVNSSAVSLATAGTYPPIRSPLGLMSVAASASIGTLFNSPIDRQYQPPKVCESGRFVHVILHIPTAATAAGSQVRGTVEIQGYFE